MKTSLHTHSSGLNVKRLTLQAPGLGQGVEQVEFHALLTGGKIVRISLGKLLAVLFKVRPIGQSTFNQKGWTHTYKGVYT